MGRECVRHSLHTDFVKVESGLGLHPSTQKTKHKPTCAKCMPFPDKLDSIAVGGPLPLYALPKDNSLGRMLDSLCRLCDFESSTGRPCAASSSYGVISLEVLGAEPALEAAKLWPKIFALRKMHGQLLSNFMKASPCVMLEQRNLICFSDALIFCSLRRTSSAMVR